MSAKIFDRNKAQLVDAQTLAEHLGFRATVIRKMAKLGHIPSLCLKNGKKEYYRFRIHEVEDALRKGNNDRDDKA